MKLGNHAYIHMLCVFVALAVVMDLIQVSYSYPSMLLCHFIILSFNKYEILQILAGIYACRYLLIYYILHPICHILSLLFISPDSFIFFSSVLSFSLLFHQRHKSNYQLNALIYTYPYISNLMISFRLHVKLQYDYIFFTRSIFQSNGL